MGKEIPHLVIPENLKPHDARFGSGPSKIRATQLAALVASVVAKVFSCGQKF